MKKLFALVLCTLMMLSIITPTASAKTATQTTTTKSDGTKTVTVVEKKTVPVFDGTRTTTTIVVTTAVDGKTTKVEEKPGGTYVGQFLDIPEDHWAARYIDWDQEYGLMNGQGNWAFNPSGELTQAEVCQIATNALRLTKGLKSTSTTSGGAWYQNALDTVREQTGILIVTPNTPATRELFCVITDAIFPTSGKQPTVVLPSDCAGLPASSREAISRCYAAEWVNGTPDGLFHPNGTLTRAEAAKISSLAVYDNLSSSAKGASPSQPMTVKDRAIARSEKVKTWARQFGWSVEQSTTSQKGNFYKGVTLHRNGKYLTLQFGGPTDGNTCSNERVQKNGDRKNVSLASVKSTLSQRAK